MLVKARLVVKVMWVLKAMLVVNFCLLCRLLVALALNYLPRGLTLAVDLAGWVVQNQTAPGLSHSVTRPHLR